MAQPIIIQEATLRKLPTSISWYLQCTPVEILCDRIDGIFHCQAFRTLSGMLRGVAVCVTVVA